MEVEAIEMMHREAYQSLKRAMAQDIDIYRPHRWHDLKSAGYIKSVLEREGHDIRSPGTKAVVAQYLKHWKQATASTHRDLYREAARKIASQRTASIRPEYMNPDVLAAFAEGFMPMHSKQRHASLRNIMRRLKELTQMFRRAPQLWEKFKEILSVDVMSELPSAVRNWINEGKAVMKRVVDRVKSLFPLILYTAPKSTVPTLTDLLNRLVDKVPGLRNALNKVPKALAPIDQWLDKYLPTLRRPLLAAVFALIWFNVAEISWDWKGLMKGFTGGISLTELFASLPESAIGAVFAMFGVGYHFLPVMLIAQLIWMVGKGIMAYRNGNLIIDWERLGVSGQRTETVSLT
ncbi:MAG: hypothetical protein LAT68_15435 [Cyclobacteriaceae bacterium]|nr:hypothetical protein [Cyclobacteriaceae bacterium]